MDSLKFESAQKHDRSHSERKNVFLRELEDVLCCKNLKFLTTEKKQSEEKLILRAFASKSGASENSFCKSFNFLNLSKMSEAEIQKSFENATKVNFVSKEESGKSSGIIADFDNGITGHDIEPVFKQSIFRNHFEKNW